LAATEIVDIFVRGGIWILRGCENSWNYKKKYRWTILTINLFCDPVKMMLTRYLW